MLFERRLRDGIHDDQVVMAFRRWKRRQVLAGHRYRTGLDLIEVDEVEVVSPADIDSGHARAAGYATPGELLADLRGDPDLPLYRIRFRRVRESDPRDELAAASSLTAEQVTAVSARLARMDRTAIRGPWTAAARAQIAGRPATSAKVLASAMGWERADFKRHVRRLKDLGLTLSLNVGYQLSPRGEAYLKSLKERE